MSSRDEFADAIIGSPDGKRRYQIIADNGILIGTPWTRIYNPAQFRCPDTEMFHQAPMIPLSYTPDGRTFGQKVNHKDIGDAYTFDHKGRGKVLLEAENVLYTALSFTLGRDQYLSSVDVYAWLDYDEFSENTYWGLYENKHAAHSIDSFFPPSSPYNIDHYAEGRTTLAFKVWTDDNGAPQQPNNFHVQAVFHCHSKPFRRVGVHAPTDIPITVEGGLDKGTG